MCRNVPNFAAVRSFLFIRFDRRLAPIHPHTMTDTPRPRALINGFGRIGRLAMRRALGAVGRAAGASAAADDVPFDIVAVNDPHAVSETAAYLLQWDSVQGVFGECVASDDGTKFTVTAPGGKPFDVAFTKFDKPADVSVMVEAEEG